MNLKNLRNEKKLTQKDISKELSIPLRTYIAYEMGEYQPNIETLIKLADYFDVSIDYLVGRRQNKKLDLSNFNETQIKVINAIPELNEKNLDRVEVYINAKIEEQNEHSKEAPTKKLI